MTAALEGGEWSAARPGRTLLPGKARYPFYRRLSGPQGRSGPTENLVPTGIRSRTVQRIVSRYTDWATGPTVKEWTCFLFSNRHNFREGLRCCLSFCRPDNNWRLCLATRYTAYSLLFICYVCLVDAEDSVNVIFFRSNSVVYSYFLWRSVSCCEVRNFWNVNQYYNINIVANGCIKRVVKLLSVCNVHIIIFNRLKTKRN